MATIQPSPAFATFRALRHPNYRLYFGGQVISLTGSWVQSAALSWLAYSLTHQSLWPALISTANVLPTLLLGVWGGSLADRFPRRWLIFAAQSGLLLLALVLAVQVAAGAVTPAGLLTVSILAGVVNAIDTPARLAFVFDLVGREDLLNAIALNSLVFNVARIVGPALGTLLLDQAGPFWCFFINALTFLAVLFALLAMRLPPREARPGPAVRSSVLDTLRQLGRQPAMLLLLLLAGAMALFGWSVLVLLPAIADQQLHAGEKGFGWLLSSVGAGALSGALLVATFGKTSRRRGFLAAGVILCAVALLGLASVQQMGLACLCCAVAGCGLILFFATGQALMNLGADEHNRGRVLGIWLMVLAGTQPAGNLLVGWGADRWGVGLVLVCEAMGIAICACLVLVLVLCFKVKWRPGQGD